MKLRIKQSLVFLMSMALTVGLLAGCGRDTKDKNGTGMGRYVEEDMEIPLKDGERLVSLSKSADKNPLLFAAGTSDVSRYEYKDGTWEESSLDWVQEAFKDQDAYVVDAEEDAEGTQVILAAVAENDSVKYHMLRGKSGETPQDLNIPYLSQDTEYGFPAISDILIDGEGNYWLQDVYQSRVVVISPDTLETIMETDTEKIVNTGITNKKMAKSEDGSVAVNTAAGVYTVYSGKAPSESGTLKLGDESEMKLCGDGESWYGVSLDGISKHQSGNDINEMIMDGSFGAMGSPINTAVTILSLSEKELYVMYNQETTDTSSLKHYVYDKDIPTVPANTLNVFGMSENATVRQAITEFQKENTDVNVVFNTSGKEGGEVTTDDIRTLNTELLGGDGADVLLLDGLPIDSYIEKGILEDLTDLTEELFKENSYMEAIMKSTAKKDGKIYGIPVKFSVPIIYGDEQVKEALESIDSLNAYMDTNPDATIFGFSDYNYIKNFLFVLFQDEILGEDKTIHQDKLAQLLELEQRIAVNTKAEQFSDMNTGYLNWDGSTSDSFQNPVGLGILRNPNAVTTDEIISAASMMIPYEVMKQLNVTAESIHGMYKPVGIAAVNKNSSQKELAEEFLKYLFSETIQSAMTDDGLPVLENALQGKVKETNEMMMGTTVSLGGDEFNITAEYPSEEQIQSLVDLSGTLTAPLEQDRIIWSLYRETAGKYLEGSIDAKEAAETIAQKVDTYLAE